ncbi:RluA family pseudouridine synthase [Guyparkeria sp.]|uniref:RluA family pseudouridine synthase n=1 Tax=Guyparkeria sp. TaxID=2035736 RepID=UPI003970A05A
MNAIDHNAPANQPPGDWALLDERRDFLVVAKPERMLSVPGIGPEKQDCLIHRVQMEFPEARIVHRLDWDTSGLLVLARNARAHSFLSKAFAARDVDKTYEALIDAPLEPAEGLIDLPIGKDHERRPRYRIDRESGRPSQTRYRLAEPVEESIRVILEPITGRSHQLRVHLLAQGRPIQGDSLYHPEAHRHTRLMLHAARLVFPDPEHPDAPKVDYHCEPPF